MEAKFPKEWCQGRGLDVKTLNWNKLDRLTGEPRPKPIKMKRYRKKCSEIVILVSHNCLFYFRLIDFEGYLIFFRKQFLGRTKFRRSPISHKSEREVYEQTNKRSLHVCSLVRKKIYVHRSAVEDRLHVKNYLKAIISGKKLSIKMKTKF